MMKSNESLNLLEYVKKGDTYLKPNPHSQQTLQYLMFDCY